MKTRVTLCAAISLSVLLAASGCSDEPSTPASPATVTLPDAVSDDYPLLLLNFDNNLVDESIYGRTVHFSGGVPSFKNGCSDRAVMFDGLDYAYVDPSPSLEPARVTVEVWMSPKRPLTNSSGFNPLVVKYAGDFWDTVDGYDLWYQDSGLGGRVGFGIGTEYGTIRKHASLTTTLLPSHLYHIVGTYDGGYARLYVDGVQVAATAFSGPLAYRGGGIRIGGGVYHSYYGGWQYYRGIIDRVAIFQRALSPQEIMTRYLECNLHALIDNTAREATDEPTFSD
jgi:hypothetical protein